MKTKMTRLAIFLASITLLSACASKSVSDDKKTIFVSITPLKAIIEELTYGDFTVEVLVPQGSSPESYDPTARQLTEASDAQLLFTTGLITFEQNLVDRIAHKERLINLSEGIELLAGCCTHNHKHSHHIQIQRTQLILRQHRQQNHDKHIEFFQKRGFLIVHCFSPNFPYSMPDNRRSFPRM